jgi:hypothetical protein
MLSFQQQVGSVVRKQLSQDHYYQLNALTARIMKRHRTLRIEKLIEYVSAEIRSHFIPTTDDMKSSVAYLLDNEMVRKNVSGELEYVP